MYDGTSPFSDKHRLQRARGLARLGVQHSRGRTRVEDLYQDGCAKVRLPKVHGTGPFEAVLLNTAGGLTGGDVFQTEVTAAPGSHVTVTTQACERVYRAVDGTAQVETRLTIANGAKLNWLPQETILFDGGRIQRRLEVDLVQDATFIAVEPLVLGRVASGEGLGKGLFQDSWRVRRGGQLIYADETRVDGMIDEITARPAALNGDKAVATVLVVSIGAEDLLATAREVLGTVQGGASAFDGMLVCRLIAADSYDLRTILIPFLTLLTGGPLPRVWYL